MTEGRYGDDYFVLFSDDESQEQSGHYGIAEMLPGSRVIGLDGWGDFIARNIAGQVFRGPAVPCIPKYLEHFEAPPADDLITDISQHSALVRCWNDKYRQLQLGGRPRTALT